MPEIRVIKRQYEPQDEIAFAEGAPTAEDSEVVEGKELAAMQVSQTSKSGFTHFIDGAQRSRLAFFDGQAPGYMAHISAAILERVEREMLRCWHEASELAFFAPTGGSALDALERAEFKVRRVEVAEEVGMSALIESVKTKIGTARDELESKLKVDWMRSDTGGWLLADGGIAYAANRASGDHRVAGVIKSHRKQYFAKRQSAEVVLNLKECERTSVFIAKTGALGQYFAYSWYLRLRDDRGESPAFGLVRVELPFVEASFGWADQVSGWLLAERAPLSLPDMRYDRMLYPIRRVEMFLNASQPSEEAMQALLGV